MEKARKMQKQYVIVNEFVYYTRRRIKKMTMQGGKIVDRNLLHDQS